MIIAVSNLSGGPGKTVSSLYLSMIAGGLLVDADPQGSATDYFDIDDETAAKHSLFSVCRRRKIDMLKISNNLSMITGDTSLLEFDGYFGDKKDKYEIISKMLKKLDYHTVIIDCPSYGGLITQNALVAADVVLIPVDATIKSVENAYNVIYNVNQIDEHYKRETKVYILPTKINRGFWSYTMSYYNKQIAPLPAPKLPIIPASTEVLRQHNEKSLEPSGRVFAAYTKVYEVLINGN